MNTKDSLRSLGLTAYEAEVYEALVRMERVKVQDLAGMVSVPRPQIYVALRGLVEKGVCVETKGPVSLYSAVNPEHAFRQVLKREEAALQAKAEAVKKLELEHQQREREEAPAHLITVLKGAQVKRYIDDMADKAQSEVLILLKSAAGQSTKSLEGAARSEIGMLGRGVRVRCLYEEASLADEQVAAILRKLLAAGEESRVIPSVPMNMMVFDDRSAMFSLASERAGVTVFAFTHPDLVLMMKTGFEFLWQQGRSTKEALSEKETRPRA